MKNHSILSGFIRALNHRLRTPLSVISNDLESLRSQLPSEEYERMRRRVTQISDMLRSLQRFSGEVSLDAAIALDDLTRAVAQARGAGGSLGALAAVRVQGHESLLRAALDGLLELVQSLPGASLLGLSLSADARTARALLSLEVSAGTVMQNAAATYGGLTEYFNETLDLDALLPPCIDSILAAHRATVSISSGDVLRLTISLPSIP